LTSLAAVLLACVAVGGSAAAVQPSKPAPARSVFGIADAGNAQALPGRELGHYLDQVRGVGARWIRVGLYWSAIQHRSASSYDWGPFDRLVRAARRRNLSILGVLLYTPAWARPSGTTETTPPADLGTYARFAGRVARHFGPLGVHAYEIWNEPNLTAFWRPAPDPARYTRMLQLAHQAIKKSDRSATVVSAGLSPYGAYGGADGHSINPLTFLEQMYDHGAESSFEALGWHPYNFPWGLGYYTWSAWSQMAATSPSALSIMRANGDGKKRIWATEWGSPTGTSSKSVSEPDQAQMIGAGLTALNAARWAGPAFLYDFRDKGTDLSSVDENFGLVRHDWSRKPAYAVFRRLATRLSR
jgi:hypothetical protein